MSKKLLLSLSIFMAASSAVAGGSHETYNSTPQNYNARSYSESMKNWIVAPYVGLEAGMVDVDLAGAGAGLEDQYTTLTPYIGFRFGPYLGLEGGYTTSQGEDSAAGDSRYESWNADLLGYIPLTESHRTEIVVQAGYGRYDLNSPIAGDTDNAWRYGAGLQYNFSDRVTARALYRKVNLDTAILGDANDYTVGLSYSF